MTTAKSQPHWVKVFKTYTNGPKRTPYKWKAECVCGWTGLSWSWRRDDEEPDTPYPSGALAMALEHVDLLSPETSPYGASIPLLP